MAQAFDILSFSKGMNKDIAPDLLPDGQYIDAQNIILNRFAGRAEGVVRNYPGIAHITDTGLVDVESGDVILYILPDNRNDDLYLFIYGEDNTYYHRIVKYDLTTDTYDTVLVSTNLGWSSTVPIKSAAISDGILFWTTGDGEVGMFDQSIDYLSMASRVAFSTGTSYVIGNIVYYENIVYRCILGTTAPNTGDEIPSGDLTDNTNWEVHDNDDITAEMLTLAKTVPQKQPTIDLVYDISYKANNIIGKFFQFKFRFIYANNQKSVFSPISEVAFSATDYRSPESVASDSATANAIDVTLTGKGVNDLVTKIEVAARSGNDGDFFLIKELDAEYSFLTGGDQTFRFYNEGLYDPIDLSESNQIYDDIPWDVQTLVYSNNRIILGNGKTGFDKPTVDYDVVPLYYDSQAPNIQTADTSGEPVPRSILSDTDGSDFEAFLAAQFSSYTLTAGDTIRIRGMKGTTYDFAVGDYSFVVSTGMTGATAVALILSKLYDNIITGEPNDLTMLGTETGGVKEQGNEYFTIYLEQAQHVKTFKSGAWYNVALQYFDEYGRTNGVLIKEDSKAYIRTIGERDTTFAAYDEVGAATLQVTITSEAPSWAKYYKIVFSRASSYDSSLQTTVKAAKADGDNIKINIAPFADWNTDKGGNLSYVWEKGDRIRLITYEQNTGSYDSVSGIWNDWADDLYEAEIIEAGTDYAGGGGDTDYWIVVPNLGTAPITESDLTNGAIIEIYRPSKELEEADTIYTEASMFYEIYSSGGSYYHRGDTDQTAIADAIVEITGDAYIKSREDYPYAAASTKNIAFEGYSISDYRDSEHYDKGRATAIINQEESENFATLMYSEVMIPNTDINNLNRFYPDVNYEEYNKSFGEIVHLFDEGDHLLMLQQDKVSKVFVERAITYDAQGNARLLGTVSQVLSKAVPYAGIYGISDARSFQAIDNNRYWLDPYRGSVLRLGASGIDKISDYGMKGYFAEACQNMLQAASPEAISVFDVYHGLYMISGTSITGCQVFSEKDNMWVCTNTIVDPSNAAYINNRTFYSYDNSLYELNDTSIASNTINDGSPAASYVKTICNIEPTELKNFLGIALRSSHALNIDIVTEGAYGETDQESSLDRTLDFTQREQEFHASFLRDVNTPKLDPDMSAGDWTNSVLLLGDTIKGFYAQITMTLPTTVADEELYLRFAKIIVSKG